MLMKELLMDIKKEIKDIRDLAEVLKVLADEVEKEGHFNKESQELLKGVGSSILFKGCSIDYLQ